MDRLRSADTRIAEVLLTLLWWAGVPIFACALIVFPARDLSGAWRAAHGRGSVGTFTTTERECDRHHCGAYGKFVSDAGNEVVEHAFLDEASDDPYVGQVIRVRYEGGRTPPVVYPASGSDEWLILLGFLVTMPFLLLLWVLSIYARVTHRFIWASRGESAESEARARSSGRAR